MRKLTVAKGLADGRDLRGSGSGMRRTEFCLGLASRDGLFGAKHYGNQEEVIRHKSHEIDFQTTNFHKPKEEE